MDEWKWKAELNLAHLTQKEVGNFLGIDKAAMSSLVKKMLVGEGKTASVLDKNRWKQALEYIAFRKEQVKKEA